MQSSVSTSSLGLSVGEFLSRLAAPAPAPGGGSAAALAGALAAALVAMVATVTAAHGPQAPNRDTMAAIQARAADLQARLAALVDEDAAAYGRLTAARRLPRSDAAEGAVRTAAIQDALQGAIAAPVAVAERSLAVLHLARQAVVDSRPLAVPDAAMAAQLAHAALAGSVRNAAANLGQLHDAGVRRQTQAHLDGLAAQGRDALAAMLQAADARSA